MVTKKMLVLSDINTISIETIKNILNESNTDEILFCGSGIEKLSSNVSSKQINDEFFSSKEEKEKMIKVLFDNNFIEAINSYYNAFLSILKEKKENLEEIKSLFIKYNDKFDELEKIIKNKRDIDTGFDEKINWICNYLTSDTMIMDFVNNEITEINKNKYPGYFENITKRNYSYIMKRIQTIESHLNILYSNIEKRLKLINNLEWNKSLINVERKIYTPMIFTENNEIEFDTVEQISLLFQIKINNFEIINGKINGDFIDTLKTLNEKDIFSYNIENYDSFFGINNKNFTKSNYNKVKFFINSSDYNHSYSMFFFFSDSIINNDIESLQSGDESLKNILYVLGDSDLNLKINYGNHLSSKTYTWNNWEIIGIDDAEFYYESLLQDNIQSLEDEHYKKFIEQLKECKSNNIIIVSYNLPYGCLDLTNNNDIETIIDPKNPVNCKCHFGSKMLRSIIEANSDRIKAVLCSCNEIFGGYVDYIKNVPVINVSNYKDYTKSHICKYANISLSDNGNFNFEIINHGIAWNEVNGIGKKRINELPQKILTNEEIESLSFSNDIKEKIRLYNEFIKRDKQSIFDLVKIINKDSINKIPKNAIFIDLETSDKTIHYLNCLNNNSFNPNDHRMDNEPLVASISLYHRDTNKTEFFSIFDEDRTLEITDQVQSLINKCINYLKSFKNVVLYSYGTFDGNVLSVFGFPYHINDMIPIIRDSILLPNYALKSVCNYLGIKYEAKIRDGAIIGMLNDHLVYEDCKYCEQYFHEVKEHNVDDVIVMEEVLAKIKEKINE